MRSQRLIPIWVAELILLLVTSPAAASLKSRLLSPDATERVGAIEDFRKLDAREQARLAKKLAKYLRSEESDYDQVLAANILGELGATAKETIPDLLNALRTPGIFAIPRLPIARALLRIEPGRPEAIATFRELLAEDDIDAVAALLELGPAAREFVPEFLGFLAGEDRHHPHREEIVKQALLALERIGNPTVPALVELFAKDDFPVRGRIQGMGTVYREFGGMHQVAANLLEKIGTPEALKGLEDRRRNVEKETRAAKENELRAEARSARERGVALRTLEPEVVTWLKRDDNDGGNFLLYNGKLGRDGLCAILVRNRRDVGTSKTALQIMQDSCSLCNALRDCPIFQREKARMEKEGF